MEDDKQRIKCLLECSYNKGKISENLTDEYKRGVLDAFYRLQFLWGCEKYVANDKNDWLVMDTYRDAMIAVELLIDPYFDILNSCDPEIFRSHDWYEMVDTGFYTIDKGTAFWGTATHYNYDHDGFKEQPRNATHVHWFTK